MALTFEEVKKIALSLQGVEQSTSYGTAAFKVGKKLIARLKEDGVTLVVGTTFEERDAMIAEESQTYFFTEHYRNYPLMLVRLSRVNADVMVDLLKRAVRLASASPRSARAKRRASRRRQ